MSSLMVSDSDLRRGFNVLRGRSSSAKGELQRVAEIARGLVAEGILNEAMPEAEFINRLRKAAATDTYKATYAADRICAEGLVAKDWATGTLQHIS